MYIFVLSLHLFLHLNAKLLIGYGTDQLSVSRLCFIQPKVKVPSTRVFVFDLFPFEASRQNK